VTLPNQAPPIFNFNELTSIDLDAQSPLAKGSIRKVFLVPGHEDHLVKVFRSNKTPHHQKRQLHMHKLPWLRHPIVFDQNRYDLRELSSLSKRVGPLIWQHFPPTYGIVDTTLGPGLVQQKIRNADGSDCLNLEVSLKNESDMPRIKEALWQFRSFLSYHHIVIRDLNTGNLLVHHDLDDALTIIMIDGFGNSDYFKWASVSRALNDKKLDRKFGRLMSYLQI